MAFIKTGEGTIISIINPNLLTEEQKKLAEQASVLKEKTGSDKNKKETK